MDFYVDTTSFVTPPVNWAYVAPFEPNTQEPRIIERQTEFASFKANAIDFFRAETGPLAPTSTLALKTEFIAEQPTTTISESAVKSVSVASGPTPNESTERIAKQRVQLMVAKYAKGMESASQEILARLEILNRRLSEQAPRISKEQVLALEAANEQLERIRSSREARSKRLGISI